MADNQQGLTPMVVGYFISGNKVLLGLRKQTAWDLGKNLISGIGGKVGDMPGLEHETADEALEREFMEEIGARPISYHVGGHVTFLFPEKPKWNQQVDVYVIDALEGEPVETEAIKPVWYEVSQLPFSQMWDDAKYFLPQLLSGKDVTAHFVYGSDNRTVHDHKVEIS